MAQLVSLLTRNRDFRYLLIAELVVFGGDWFALIPLMTLLQRLTHSGLPGAVALAADTTVGAVVLPFAGMFADRFNRRTLMVAANIGTMLAVAMLLAVRSPGVAWLGPVAIGLASTAKSLYSPSASAALPNLVDPGDLPTANALAGSAWGTMTVIGASLGGLLSQAFSPYACFIIDVCCLAVAALLVLRVRRPLQMPRTTPPANPARELAAAVRFVRTRPRVLSLVTVKSGVAVGNGVLAVFPVLAVALFGLGAIATGLLFAARGLGALLGPLLFQRVLRRGNWLMPALAISMVSYGVAYLLAAASPWFWLLLVLVAVAHLSGGGNWVASNYALQVEVPDALRGRVLGLDLMITSICISASTLLAGAVVDHIGPRWTVAMCGSLTLCYAVIWRFATHSAAVVRPALERPAPDAA